MWDLAVSGISFLEMSNLLFWMWDGLVRVSSYFELGFTKRKAQLRIQDKRCTKPMTRCSLSCVKSIMILKAAYLGPFWMLNLGARNKEQGDRKEGLWRPHGMRTLAYVRVEQ